MLAPSRMETSSAFIDWLEHQDGEGRIFLSVITIHELEKGIALLKSKRAKAKAALLTTWLAGLLSAYADKIIAFDAQAASHAGRLEAKAIAARHQPGMTDAAIAGIAQTGGFTILTGNARHFLLFDVPVLSPGEAVS